MSATQLRTTWTHPPVHPYIGTHIDSPMKTTIELPEALFAKAKRVARARGMTLKALIEQGLRQVLAEKKDAPAFKLRDASVGGTGLSAEYQNATWEQMRDTLYGGRGA